DIKELKKGTSVDLTADFSSLAALPHNEFLEDVSKITIFIENQVNGKKTIPLTAAKNKNLRGREFARTTS
ncbi:MAG TPA: hypothetical protein DDX75_12875, partial [Phycisphaerales bacterium]|nr:hypothetical protein [Phycisphaerales bacterium]